MIYPLLVLSILIWPFGQLLNLTLPGISLTIYPLDIVCGLLAVSLFYSTRSRQTVFHDPLFKPLAYFLLATVLSLIFNVKTLIAGEIAYPIFYLARLIIYPSVYFAVKLSPGKKIIQYTLLSLLVFSAIGLLQYWLFPDMRFLKLLGYDDHYYRLIGSFFDPNFSGAIFASGALVFLSLGLWTPALSLVFLLALTFSRASYLIFILGLFYIYIIKFSLSSTRMRGSTWILIGCLILFISIIILIPKPFGEGVNLARTFSIFSRIESWQSGLNLFFQRPLFGWGYNTLRSITGDRFQIDNSYLYLAATTGLVGSVAFINLLWNIYYLVKPLPQRLFILGLLTHGLFNNTLFYIWIYFAFWLVIGLPFKEYKGS